jgi:hypothetical protein
MMAAIPKAGEINGAKRPPERAAVLGFHLLTFRFPQDALDGFPAE